MPRANRSLSAWLCLAHHAQNLFKPFQSFSRFGSFKPLRRKRTRLDSTSFSARDHRRYLYGSSKPRIMRRRISMRCMQYEALIDLRIFSVIRGFLPGRAMALVLEWADDHRDELLENWNLCRRMQTPKPIEPLK
jgi:hypothetical protein